MNSVVRKKLLMADGDVNSTAAVALFFEAQTSKCAPGGQRSALWLLIIGRALAGWAPLEYQSG
jgi:hypothetical protein